MSISYDEAYKASLEYFDGDDLAAKVFVDKYALRDNDNNLLELTPTDMHRRLAKEFARIEKGKFAKPMTEEEIFGCLDHFKYIIPQGSILYGLGNIYQYISLSNCFVLDQPHDSYSRICYTDEQILHVSKARGGCGTDISLLRPKGAKTRNASRSSTGPISFAKRYSYSIREVATEGRRGSLMLSMDCKHPDILDFATCKNDKTQVTGANISIRLHDDFITSALNKKKYIHQWPIDSNNPSISQEKDAYHTWQTIAKSAWETGEPGCMFWDNMTKESIGLCYEKYGFKEVSSNPCLTGNMLLLTPNGHKRIADINTGDKIWSQEGWTTILFKEITQNKQVNRYITSINSIECTPNHIIISNGKKIPIEDAQTIDCFNSNLSDKELITSQILKIEQLSDTTVYNIIVNNKSHTYWANGFNISNCGEIYLPPFDSCRLLLLNLYSFIKSPFTNNAYFDYNLFYDYVKIAQRLMDDIIDLELECIDKIINKIKKDNEIEEIKGRELHLWEKIRRMCKSGRRTGTGTTGLADALAALNIKYGHQNSLIEIDKIFRTLKFGCYYSSIDMAKELGPFPIWNHKLECNNPFLNRIKNEDISEYVDSINYTGKDLYNDMIKYGRRNITCLTLSPAGTVSLEAQTSSGGEPLFYLNSKRRKKGNIDDPDFRCDFTDKTGDHWMEFTIDHPKLKIWKNITNNTNIKQSPWYGCCAEDINYKDRISILSIMQKNIDNSISSCLATNHNMIQTDNGLYYVEELSELARAKDEKTFYNIDNFNSINKDGILTKISQVYNNGIANTIKLKLFNNANIIATPNHKLCILNHEYNLEWRELKDIQIGDYIVSRKGLKLFTKDNRNIEILPKFKTHKKNISKATLPKYLSLELARFLGYMCADGHVDKNSFNLSQQKNNICEDFIKLVKHLFNLDAVYRKDARTKNLYSLVVNSVIVCDWLKEIGLINHNDIKVPKIIRHHATFNQTKEFIRGITLDGYVTKNSICISTSVSKQYLAEIQQLLLNFGFNARIEQSNKAGLRKFPNNRIYQTKDAYCLSIHNLYSMNQFVTQIGFAEDKKIKISNKLFPGILYKHTEGKIPDYGIRAKFLKDIYPQIKSYELKKYLSKILNKRSRSFNLERETLAKLVDLGLKVPEYLLDNTYDFIEIREKEDYINTQTYDLFVPDGNSYIVNGVISHNTINLPEDSTVETVEQIYELAWKKGLKGITVYRKNSRDGVILDNKKIDKQIAVRPKELPCDVYHVSVHGQKYFVLIGLEEGKPVECFSGKNGVLDKDIKHGKIVKRKRNFYSFVADGSNEPDLSPITASMNEMEKTVSRLLSGLLRSNLGLDFILKQLEKIGETEELTSFTKCLSRVLRHYYTSNEVEVSTETCPECKAILVRKDGCWGCSKCNFTKCG